MLLIFARVALEELDTIFGVMFRLAVPYWRISDCLNISMGMLLFIIVE
jgi:hypothetical protein